MIAGVSSGALAFGCGGGPPPPTLLKLRLSASQDANSDGAGAPKPLKVRMLQLAGTTALSQADFFSIDADPAKALGPDLLATEELVLRPGQTVSLDREARPGTRFVGLVAAYFAIDRARWRAWAPVKPNIRNDYVAKFDAAGVAFTGGGA